MSQIHSIVFVYSLFHYKCKFFAILIFSLIVQSTTGNTVVLEDGKFYTITNAATNKLMTVSGKGFVRNAPIVTMPWVGADTQIWLALRPKLRQERSTGGLSTTQTFVLIPKKQKWDWKEKIAEGKFNWKIDSLPEETVVLTLDPSTVNLTQEVYTQNAKQHWFTEDIGNGKVWLRNWGNQQCIKNFDHKPLNVLQLVRKRIETFFGQFTRSTPSPLGTLNCHKRDVSERWILEQYE